MKTEDTDDEGLTPDEEVIKEMAAETAGLRALVGERDAVIRTLKSLIRQLLTDLPQKRDWLDPSLEAELKLQSEEARKP